MSELNHECGIAALYHLESPTPSQLAPEGNPEMVARLMPRVLLDLQNRGQLAAGITSYNADRQQILSTYKRLGTVIEAFRLNHRAKFDNIMNEHGGRAVIGHVRYATCGANDVNYAQPFERPHGCKWKWFSLAFNGQLANFADLRAQLLDLTDYHLTRETDTEVIMHYLAHALRRDERLDLVDVFRELCRQFDGAYNIVYLNAMGDMAILRDPKGFRIVRRRQRECTVAQPGL
jgi:amidophosphoribosyltransferase